ncbi:hypothetical protein K435DRAFT_867265 [Dendrothele bispora CBS 962.96]|uniref:Uncharacterized protein n=1 Tax=Dendrothele bispora (strain CBS 962.96) TaxID=1314807 RepID=A0A4V4HDJ4_DENBC|nr:hypothetical protein K435DRAFT_867265 [Dendrothele bispora CBS 962.96]
MSNYTSPIANDSLVHYSNDPALVKKCDPSPATLLDWEKELLVFANAERVASFDSEKMSWASYELPRENRSPPDYTRTEGYVPPLCPHIVNPRRTRVECEMVVRGSDGLFFFQAPHDGGCAFIVPIPPSSNFEPCSHVNNPQCVFDEYLARARTEADESLISLILDAQEDGIFDVFSQLHPAYDHPGRPLPVLATYNPNGISQDRINSHKFYKSSGIGRALGALCSDTGLSSALLDKLVNISHQCPGCECHYSPNGFFGHLDHGRCMNTPSYLLVKEITVLMPCQLVAVSCDKMRELTHSPPIDSAITRAFWEWNSCLGIPADVWTVITTSVSQCPICNMMRIFPAAKLHKCGLASGSSAGGTESESEDETVDEGETEV